MYPDGECALSCGRLTWEGSVTPSPLSETYRVRLRYQLHYLPKVFVIEPQLVCPSGEKLPHVWSDGSLCLYYSKYGEWKPHMLLADTILPWTSEWLYHYELWRVTGEWHGGGVH